MMIRRTIRGERGTIPGGVQSPHSDHVLNGIRRGVATGTARLPAEQVALHFFHDEQAGENTVESMELLKTGQLSAWPPGFFDQSQRDLAALARVQRRKP
ncbi:MAG: DUF3696 domain-containing protein [Myxococcota bacterium]